MLVRTPIPTHVHHVIVLEIRQRLVLFVRLIDLMQSFNNRSMKIVGRRSLDLFGHVLSRRLVLDIILDQYYESAVQIMDLKKEVDRCPRPRLLVAMAMVE